MCKNLKISQILTNPGVLESNFVNPRERKNYFEATRAWQWQLRTKFLDSLFSMQSVHQLFLDHGLRVGSINFIKAEKDISLDEIKKQCSINVQIETKVDKDEQIYRVAMARDLTFLSYNNYDVFNQTAQTKLPSSYFLRKQDEKINNLMPQIHTNDYGCYFKPLEKITWVLNLKINKFKLKSNIIRICMRGDKTLVGSNQSFFNFLFSLPDEGDVSKTAYGQSTLGFFIIKNDNYEALSIALREISLQIRDLKEISINNTIYTIEWHLGGDMAFIRTERGLQSCSANFSCFHCTIHKDNFYKNNHATIYKDGSGLLRTISDSDDYCAKAKQKDRKGYRNKAIFDFIPYKRIHIDPLHETIRIPEQLLRLVYIELIKHDNKKSKNLNELPNQKKLLNWLEYIGIKNAYKEKTQYCKDNAPDFILNSFSAKQYKLISKLFNAEVISGLKNNEEIARLFNNYYRINQGYTHNFYINKIELFQKRVEEWQKLFNRNFHTKYNTVYMHYLTDHVAKAIEENGDIDLFNCSGIEKANDITSTEYFRATNRKVNVAEQLLFKRTRLEYYRLNKKSLDSEHTKRKKEAHIIFFKNTDLYEISNLEVLDELKKNKFDETTNFESIESILESASENEYDEFDDEEIEEKNIELDQVLLSANDNTKKTIFEEREEIQISNKKQKLNNLDEAETKRATEFLKNDSEYVYYQIEDVPILKKDIKSLEEKKWLTDVIIDSFMKSISNKKKVLVLSYNIAGLIANYESIDKKNSLIKKILEKDLSKYDYIGGPVFVNNCHWTLLFISNISKQLFYIDSIGDINNLKLLRVFKNFESFVIDSKYLKGKYEPCVQSHQFQNDDYNCGVYVCYNFKLFITQNMHLLNEKYDINKYREEIKKNIELNSEIKICCICKKKISDGVFSIFSSKFIKYDCKHKFHSECIKQDKSQINDKCIICF